MANKILAEICAMHINKTKYNFINLFLNLIILAHDDSSFVYNPDDIFKRFI